MIYTQYLSSGKSCSSGSGSSAFYKSHLSPSRSRFITKHRAIFWSHRSPVFPPSFFFKRRKRAILIKVQCVTDTTPVRIGVPHTNKKDELHGFAEVKELALNMMLDVSLT